MAYKRSPEAARRKRQRQYQRLQPRIEALYEELFQRFPQTFFRAPQDVHPLKIGIFPELCARIAAPRRVLKHVIERYTRQRAYLQALAEGKPRLDLSGRAVETVSDSHRVHAQARLNHKTNQRRSPRRPKAEHTAHETTPPATVLQKAQEAYEATPIPTSGITQTDWRKSITRHAVTCLACGDTFKQLSIRHLRLHGLDGHSYRVKYGIPRTQPLAARATTERRRQVAREIRPWEKAPRYRQGQARQEPASPEPEAETLPEETEGSSVAAPTQPKRPRKDPKAKECVKEAGSRR